MTVTLKHSVLQAMNDVIVTTVFFDRRGLQAGTSQTQHILKTSKKINLKLKLTRSSQVEDSNCILDEFIDPNLPIVDFHYITNRLLMNY